MKFAAFESFQGVYEMLDQIVMPPLPPLCCYLVKQCSIITIFGRHMPARMLA